MRLAICASLFLLVSGVFGFAQSKNIDGHWAAEYVHGLQMKTTGGAEFEFEMNHGHLNWYG